jgi:hypothetical protein
MNETGIILIGLGTFVLSCLILKCYLDNKKHKKIYISTKQIIHFNKSNKIININEDQIQFIDEINLENNQTRIPEQI